MVAYSVQVYFHLYQGQFLLNTRMMKKIRCLFLKKKKNEKFNGHGHTPGPSIFSPLPSTISIENDNDEENTMLVPKKIIIAIGSESKELKELPFDEELILSSTGALNLTELPKRVCIIGAGAIGIEWASMLVDLDVEVTVIEKDKNILPQVDFDVREKIKSILEARGVEFYLESQFTTNITNDSTIDFKINEKEEVTVDKVIVSIGRESLINEIGLANTSIKYDNGFIKTNEFYQTDESHM